MEIKRTNEEWLKKCFVGWLNKEASLFNLQKAFLGLGWWKRLNLGGKEVVVGKGIMSSLMMNQSKKNGEVRCTWAKPTFAKALTRFCLAKLTFVSQSGPQQDDDK